MTTALLTDFAADVARDLARTPKQLQSKYLYDDLGSSLFEAICRLPWYRITRAEQRLLGRYAPSIIETVTGGDRGVEPCIIELGCGSGEKLATLAAALQMADGSGRVHLIDVSAQALEDSERRLGQFRHVSVVGHRETYEVGLRRAASARDGAGPILVLLLGSNIGNFDAPAARDFIRNIRRALAPGDFLLLGADLVKPERDLLLAYDDPLGVTAAFNRNLLVRINRELGGTFEVAAFAHRAVWNRSVQRVEMHLESLVSQRARVAAAGTTIAFEAGERIWTESSYKYEPGQIADLGRAADFTVAEAWIDEPARFALTLFVV